MDSVKAPILGKFYKVRKCRDIINKSDFVINNS